MRIRLFSFALLLAGTLVSAHAGGPRYVAGSPYFDPSHQGQPVLWPAGTIAYFTDRGDLSATVTNAVANTTVAAAAAAWNAVPTAAVSIRSAGRLAEDVNGSNVIASNSGVGMPDDIRSSAIATPVGIVYDADGEVIDAFFGTDASDPDDCIDSGVMNIVDNLATDGTIAHALILVNGRCTGTAAQLQQIQFQLMRAFGRVLGLGWAQANDEVQSSSTTPSYQQLEGWPVMRPIDRNCDQLSAQCVPYALQLRPDDTAALSRLYPVTPANLAQFPGKQVTVENTLSIHGSVYFRRSQGMQGVNVIARPITPGVRQPDDRYPVASVTGFLYTGNRGNPVTGSADNSGEAFWNFGSDDPLLEGFYDLSGIPLPPGATEADYQITLEAVNPLYTGALAVGSYALGAVTPSGTLPAITLYSLTAGMSVEQDFTIADSAGDLQTDSGGVFSTPTPLPAAGEWEGRAVAPGDSSWFSLHVAAGRHFTIETSALDETGYPSENKMRGVIGVWDASLPEGSPATIATVAPFNGAATGVTALGVDAIGDGELLLAIADQRGDGRPDYAYRGRLLYAASVTPAQLPLTGGLIQINGSGFRPGMTVTLGTQIMATVTDIAPTRILANVPSQSLPSGSLDLVVRDPATNGSAVIASGISYGAALGDTMSIATALPSTLNVAAAAPFSVRVFGPDQVTPVAGVPVTFSVLQGSATFAGCTTAVCTITTSGDGYAPVMITPGAPGFIKIQAALTPGGTTGAMLDAELTGVTPLAILPVNSTIFLAPGATFHWMAQVQVVAGEAPMANALVNWSTTESLAGQYGASMTDSQGQASFPFTLGPWPAGTSAPVNACIAGTSTCASYSVFVVHAETEKMVAVSGLMQSVVAGTGLSAILVRVVAPSGQPVMGAVVSFMASIRSWTPACSPGGPCPQGRLLGTLSQQLSSDAAGLVSFQPVLPPGVPAGTPIRLTGQAEAGTSANLPFLAEIRP